MGETSTIELSRSAYANNIRFLRSIINEKITLSCVLKGNAYGHGIEQVAQLAQENGITHFSVFSRYEAERLLQVVDENVSIMIMGDHCNDWEWIVKNRIDCFIYNQESLEAILRKGIELGIKPRIHIEFETGMNRTGFNTKELTPLMNQLIDNKDKFSLEGVCTHLAGAESITNYHRLQKQLRLFNHVIKKFEQNNLKPKYKHSACSAALMNYPKSTFNLVRVGILQYGFWPSKETFIKHVFNNKFKEDPLKRVIGWKTRVLDCKSVKAGEFIGYGTSYLAERDTVVAVLPVGYSNGYSRSLSNTGRIIINGIRVGVVGTINMNMTLVDVTDLDEVSIGDTAILIGEENGHKITVSSFSELSNQLNYELLTRLPNSIERKII